MRGGNALIGPGGLQPPTYGYDETFVRRAAVAARRCGTAANGWLRDRGGARSGGPDMTGCAGLPRPSRAGAGRDRAALT
jgi:hypothetical protein